MPEFWGSGEIKVFRFFSSEKNILTVFYCGLAYASGAASPPPCGAARVARLGVALPGEAPQYAAVAPLREVLHELPDVELHDARRHEARAERPPVLAGSHSAERRRAG